MPDSFKVADLLDAVGATVRGVRVASEDRDAGLRADIQATNDAMQTLADRLGRAEHDASEARAAVARLEARIAALEAEKAASPAAAGRARALDLLGLRRIIARG